MPVKRKRSAPLTGSYKKQHGFHHKHTDRYLKVYWPYIPVLFFVIFGIVTAIVLLYLKPAESSINSSISTDSLLNSTNQARADKRLNPLTMNSELASAAQTKANQMATQNYWSPVSPSGQTPWQIVKQTGYSYQTAGENLAYGFSTTSGLFDAWLSSSSHNQNIYNSNYNDVGFGIAKSSDFQNKGPQTIVVAIYANPANGSASPSQSSIGTASFTTASITEPKSVTITKIEALTNDYALNSIFISGLIVGIIGCYLVIKHFMLIRKFVLEGEQAVVSHPYLDLILVIFIVGIAILNQTVGVIN